MSKTTQMLKGFEIVASDSIPTITLDNQRRFYINTSARRLMGVNPYERLAVAYNPSEKALAIVKGGSADAYPTSNYSVDKRFYMSARHFASYCGYPPEQAPYSFVYERGASDGNVFIFRLLYK